jgi:hypothetical protein
MPLYRTQTLTLFATLLLSACGSDGDGLTEPDLSPENGTMTATVDGMSWSAIQIAIVRGGNIITIGAANIDLIAIGIAWQDQGVGTYTIGGTPLATANLSEGGSNSWQANGVLGSGSVTITSVSATRVTGTFVFTAEASAGSGTPASRVVTNGAFDIAFP